MVVKILRLARGRRRRHRRGILNGFKARPVPLTKQAGRRPTAAASGYRLHLAAPGSKATCRWPACSSIPSLICTASRRHPSCWPDQVYEGHHAGAECPDQPGRRLEPYFLVASSCSSPSPIVANYFMPRTAGIPPRALHPPGGPVDLPSDRAEEVIFGALASAAVSSGTFADVSMGPDGDTNRDRHPAAVNLAIGRPDYNARARRQCRFRRQ